jgi:hypothetical protein
MSSGLRVRILDMHTVSLGRDGHWTALSLPWLARDLPHLMTRLAAGDGATGDGAGADAQRLAALRLVLATLDAGETSTAPAALAGPPIDARDHHHAAKRINAGRPLPPEGPLVILARPAELLDLWPAVAARRPGSAVSVIVYSDLGVLVGPTVQSERLCPLCFRFMTGIELGLDGEDARAATAMRTLGLALARALPRSADDTLILRDGQLRCEPFVPYIGCPTCVPPRCAPAR